MRLEARKYLYDIKQAADLLGEFTDGKQFSDYRENSMLRAAVERKFEIIGEALSKLALFASEQTAIELVSAARQDADVLDIRMFGIEENIRV